MYLCWGGTDFASFYDFDICFWNRSHIVGFFSHFIDNGTMLVVIEHWFISVVIDQP